MRELAPLVSASAIAAGRAGAHRDAEDVRPAAARARRAAVRGRSPAGQVAALPDRRRRAAAANPPDERRPDPPSRIREEGPEDAGVPASVRGRRRARAHRVRPEEARRRLARVAGGRPRPSSPTSVPKRWGSASRRLREILAGDNRRLHSLLRDQRALAGIGRAHANEILHRAQLSPFALSSKLGDEEIERLAAAIDEDLARALELREQGKGDKDVYLVHRRLGRAVPALRRPAPAGRLRGAHGLLLRALPDGRARAQGPEDVAPAPVAPSSTDGTQVARPARPRAGALDVDVVLGVGGAAAAARPSGSSAPRRAPG